MRGDFGNWPTIHIFQTDQNSEQKNCFAEDMWKTYERTKKGRKCNSLNFSRIDITYPRFQIPILTKWHPKDNPLCGVGCGALASNTPEDETESFMFPPSPVSKFT